MAEFVLRQEENIASGENINDKNDTEDRSLLEQTKGKILMPPPGATDMENRCTQKKPCNISHRVHPEVAKIH